MIPPRWLYHAVWAVHRGIDRLSRGRLSTRTPGAGRLGLLFLETIGRRSGRIRRNGLFYLADGAAFVVVASNAGAPADPAWWHNLQARPDAAVEIGGRRIVVRARRASPSEEAVLHERFSAASGQYERYPRMAGRPLPVVLLEPLDAGPGAPTDRQRSEGEGQPDALPLVGEVEDRDHDDQDAGRDLDPAVVGDDDTGHLAGPQPGQEGEQHER